MMNGLQIGSHVEEVMVPLTSSHPEPVKYGSKVKNKDQEQRCSDHARKEHPPLKPGGPADHLSCVVSVESCTPRLSTQLQIKRIISTSLTGL